MKRILFFISFAFSCILCIGQGPSSPTVWLRADSAVLGAASWRDVSGNGFDATPSSGAMPSAFSRMNFNKCFEVNGETFTLPLGINDTKRSDVIVVYETYDTLGENALWQIDIDSAKRIGQTTHRILNDNGQITYDTANRLKPVINYLAQSWRTPEVCAPTLTLCASDSLTLSGRIAEALYFDRHLSDTSIVQWISYLAIKYGITLVETDYMDSRRNVIWDHTDHPDYCTSIAGVGRDDSVGLNQKQTFYADGKMIVSVAETQDSESLQTENNEDNPAFIADGDFIVFGMDGVVPAVSEIYTQSGETYEVIGRSLAQVTGNAYGYQTCILLDTAGVNDSVAPVLMIDRSGTGEFSDGEPELVLCSGTDSLGRCIYGSVQWDTDQNGLDFFCFAVRMPGMADTPKAMAADGTAQVAMHHDQPQNGRKDMTSCFPSDSGNGSELKNTDSKSAQYSLAPNPNHGCFIVEAQYPEAQDVVVNIYDADGRLLLALSGKGKRFYRFDGEVPTAGQYLIDIIAPMERKTLKMVVN
ncbi:MAG: T9SS type A sorting domain-containing protein [Bacteroidales bacterium]|nr:T9SS type A sorting domain-containing protein [Bacteroidales bacterium]